MVEQLIKTAVGIILIGISLIAACGLYLRFLTAADMAEHVALWRQELVGALIPLLLFCIGYKFFLQWQYTETMNPLKRKFWRHPIKSYQS